MSYCFPHGYELLGRISQFLLSVDVQADLDLLLGIDKNVQQRFAAIFLLKLKEHRRILQVALDDGLFSSSVQCLNAKIHEKLASAGIEVSSIDGL